MSQIKNDKAAARLREERTRLRLSQTDFAEKGGVKIATQTRYEAGSSSPDLDYLTSIAGHGADVVYILTGSRSSRGLSDEEAEIIGNLRQLPSHQFHALGQLVCSMVERPIVSEIDPSSE